MNTTKEGQEIQLQKDESPCSSKKIISPKTKELSTFFTP
jgi:hypothetical protein